MIFDQKTFLVFLVMLDGKIFELGIYPLSGNVLIRCSLADTQNNPRKSGDNYGFVDDPHPI